MTCQVWGVLNVTTDSFSDGGKFVDLDAALKQAKDMIAAGASVIDVGGESTRPGAERVSVETELSRVLPVIKALSTEGIATSIDTMRAEVAAEAIEAGATIVNDVSGGKADPNMYTVVADADVEYVLMHWRGHSDVMNELAVYSDVTTEVITEWQLQADKAIEAGINPARIIFDPGIGFAKNELQNWELLKNIDRFMELPHRVLIGASRKRFLAGMVANNRLEFADPTDRDAATATVSFYAAVAGASFVRVHEVSSSVAAIRVASALNLGGSDV
jgi:dihydropteroate synthase